MSARAAIRNPPEVEALVARYRDAIDAEVRGAAASVGELSAIRRSLRAFDDLRDELLRAGLTGAQADRVLDRLLAEAWARAGLPRGMSRGGRRNPVRRRNLFGFGGGGRQVITVDEARGRQMEAADSFCKHHEYKQAQRVAKQSPKSWAKEHNLQLEGVRHRVARKVRHKAASALSGWAKRIEGNPDQPAGQLQYYGGYGAVPSAWYRMSAHGLESLRRALLDPNFYHKESPEASAARERADLDALAVAIGESRRYGARVFVAHDRHGWYIARDSEPRVENPGVHSDAGIRFVIGRPKGRTSTEVQSVLFDRRSWTVDEAKRWLRFNGFRAPVADEPGPRGHDMRFRQMDPGEFQRGSFRDIAPGDHSHHRRNPFKVLEEELAARGAYDPAALAAYIERRKHGEAWLEKRAEAGRRRAERRRSGRRNPEDDGAAGLEAAAEVFEQFQGRKPQQVLELQQSDIQRSEFAKLGDLVSLTVLDPEKKKCKIEFGPEDEVIVASSVNAKQLYVLGGNQDVRPLLETLGCDGSKDFVELGPCIQIEYFTHKRLDHFEPVRYYHDFGEETGDMPVLVFDQLNVQLLLVGGAYEVKPEGIVN